MVREITVHYQNRDNDVWLITRMLLDTPVPIIEEDGYWFHYEDHSILADNYHNNGSISPFETKRFKQLLTHICANNSSIVECESTHAGVKYQVKFTHE